MHDKPSTDELDNRFRYHPPIGNQTVIYEHIRKSCRELAKIIADNVPHSRESALALTHLEQVMFFANAAVARRS